jgi:ribosomal peptide maturation radical SAM protein 1
LGILRSVLENAHMPVGVRSFNLLLMERLAEVTADRDERERLTIADYDAVSENEHGLGDWLFSGAPFRDPDPERDRAFLDHLRAGGWLPERLVAKLEPIRAAVPAFLEECAKDILASEASVVGFTSSFAQNVPSLALSKKLKTLHPSLKIVCGGANCEGKMGEALLRHHPWIDVVVRGEAEGILVPLMRELVAGEQVTPRPGLCVRTGDSIWSVESSSELQVEMDAVPTPNYDEYFERVRRSPTLLQLLPEIRMPFEAARGCWWGEKSQCRFCGLNGTNLRFRSKSPGHVLDDVVSLAKRHRWLDFDAIENVVDTTYFDTLFPRLRAEMPDGRFFYETRANLTLGQLRVLRDAGVRSIQPGIESLSSPILKLMGKGVTALQNIRLLKWCTSLGIVVAWKIIFGFPGEPVEEYTRMADLIPSLTHLQPPRFGPLSIERFSPYFEDPGRYGLVNVRPAEHYRWLYEMPPEALYDIGYDFLADHADGRDPDTYVGPTRDAVRDWHARALHTLGRLRYRKGPDFLVITDGRFNASRAVYSLDALWSDIYLACDAGTTAERVQAAVEDRGHAETLTKIGEILDELVANRLMYVEDGLYLSLALPAGMDS